MTLRHLTDLRILALSLSVSASLLVSAPAHAAPQAAGDFNDDGIDDAAVGIEGKTISAQAAAGAVQVILGKSNGLRFGDDLIIHQNRAGSEDQAEANDRFGRVVAVGDFNNDGFADLAVGVPLEDLSNRDNAGAVHAFYGTAAGPAIADDQVWSENAGLGGVVDDNEFFGTALAVGDFDNDGFDDLAIGVPGESLSDIQMSAGVVYVLFGSSSGLEAAGAELLSQNAGTILDIAENQDRFGTALAAGDFDNDGFDDLAVGVPGESINTIQRTGGVNAIYGSSVGLTSVGNQFWSQNSTNIDDVSEVDDAFGQALIAGDFNGDGRDDLAIGVPNESVGSATRTGAVNVLLGALNGLGAAGDKYFNQATPGVLEDAEIDDFFGFALASGDFNLDGFADLAIGSPGDSIGANAGAGCVNVIYGSATGLNAAASQLWSQATAGVQDNSEAGDSFGESLCSGDFNGDGAADLLVGVPLEDVGAKANAGAIQAIYGSKSGLASAGNQFISQDTPNAEGVAKEGDRFGGQRLNLY